MILLIHISIALASVAYATYAFFSPSKTKLRVSYGLVAATIITGTYLVAISPAHMIQACTSGLIYIGVVSVAIVSAQRKLADASID